MLSEINLFDRKALCDSETSLGSNSFRRLAMVLDIILYRMLQRLIGQKSLAFSGDLIFGIREMNV